MSFQIKQSGALEVYEVATSIPEFGNDAYNLEEYKKRLKPPYLALICYHQHTAVGFKVGYQRGPVGSFYSWMGGVLPDYRKQGIARNLADTQEKWAKAQGFTRVWFKTHNRNRAMLLFALSNGFYISEVIEKPHLIDYRIILEKAL